MTRPRPLLAHRFPIRHDVYRRAVTLLYGTREQIERYLKRYAPRDYEPLGASAAAHWRCHIDADGYQQDYVCVVRGKTNGIPISVLLAHEISHFVFHALRVAGLSIDAHSEEAFCYYHMHHMIQCLAVLERKR